MVRQSPPIEQQLPMTHLSDAYHLRDIAEAGSLRPTQCRVFDEPLLYLFYGRPAYRVAAQVESSGLEAYYPVCFVLRNSAKGAKRIYPFDSGAFHQGRFADFVHRDMIKEDFELDVDPTMPGRLMNLFWSDPRAYFDNRGARAMDLDPFDFEAKSYAELIRAKANGPFDERHSAIEVQMPQSIPLAGNLTAVILPSNFASEPVRRRVDELGALVLPFDTVSRHSPDNMVGQIYDICRDLYSGRHNGVKCW
ncbi:hypothetical protein E5673_14760 [Sphingomonas sp. PAMC26645]|nr:hypothetical protein E5673_14760 [Sphingomonas sp. PAMC26645]